MSEAKNFFIKMDEFIFQKLDAVKNDSYFQKMNEYLSGIEEDQQKVFAQAITFSLILIPYLIVAILWWGNFKSKQSIEIKNQILEQIASLNGSKDTLNSVSSNYVSPNSINGKEELESKLINMISTTGIDQSKVQVINFSQISSSSSFSKIQATLNFKKFGTQDFSNFLRSLVEQEKFKVMKINLQKDATSNLLSGDITLLHLGKVQPLQY